MKRISTVVLCLLMLVSFCVISASAAGSIEDCAAGDHSWRYSYTESTATVTQGAVEVYQCSVCYTTETRTGEPLPITNVDVYTSYRNMVVGDTYSGYSVYTTPSGGKSLLTYSSTDENVAVVDETGTVTAVGAGSARIYATAPSGASDYFTVYVKCSAPVVTTTSETDRIIVSWDPIQGSSGYTVSRSASRYGTYETVAVLSGSESASYEDVNVVLGITYWYKVRAIADDDDYTGDLSEPVSGVVKLSAPSVAVTSVKPGEVTLSLEYTEHGKYVHIYRSTSENGSYSEIANVTDGSTTYTDTTASSGKTYYYRVAVADANDTGLSDYSNVVSALVKFAATKVTVTAAPAGVTLKWNKAEGCSGYAIYRAAAGSSSFKLIKTVTAAGTVSYKDTTASSGKSYQYKILIKGTESAYDSEYSNVVTAVVKYAAPAIKSVKAVPGSVTITWNKVAGCAGYNVCRSTTKDGTYKVIKSISSANTLSYKDTSVSSGKTYYYKLVAKGSESKYNSAFSSIKSAAIQFKAPQSVTVSASTANKTVTVKWSKVSGCAGYTVYRSTTKNGTYKAIKTVSGAGTVSYKDTAVSAGKTYFYAVRANGSAKAYHSANSVVKSAALKFKTTTVTVTGTLNNVTVKWTKVANASGYTIYRSTSKTGTYKAIKTVNGAGTVKYVDSSVVKGNTYYYKIRVNGASGAYHSALSSAAGAKVTISAPKMKTSVASTANSVKIGWSKVTGAAGYYLYRRANSSAAWTKIATLTGNASVSYTDQSISGNYYYCVCAYTTANGKQLVSEYSPAIRAGTVGLVTNVKADAESGDPDTDTITWKKVSGATGYIIYGKLAGNPDASSGWIKLATVDGNQNSYVRIEPPTTHSQKYYYKVKAIKSFNGVTCTGQLSTSYSWTSWYLYPKFSVFMSSKTDSDASLTAATITNKGSQTMRVYARDGRLVDRSYSSFNRNVTKLCYLVNGNLYYADYLDIAPNSSMTIGFVFNSNTWYDKYSRLYFDFSYDGKNYYCSSSYYYGSTYYKD